MDKKTIGTNVLWNSVGSLFFLGCQWLLTVLVVRLSSSYEYAGILSLGFSISNTVYGIATLNLRTMQITELDNRFRDGDFIISRLFSVALAMVITVIVVLVSGYNSYTALCIILFICYRMVEAFADVFHGIEQKVWRMDIIGKTFLIRGTLTLLTFVVGLVCFHDLLLSIVLMLVSNYLAFYFFDLGMCKKHVTVDRGWNLPHTIHLIKIGIPISIQCVLLNSIGTIPRMEIEKICGEDLLGIFASVSMPAVLVSQVASYFFTPLLNLFARYRQTKSTKPAVVLIGGCTLGIFLLTAVTILLSVLVADFAFGLLFGPSILAYTYLFPYILLTTGMLALVWFLNGLLTAMGRYKAIVWITCLPTALTLLCSGHFIRQYSLMGAVIITILAYGASILPSVIYLFYCIKKDFS